MKCKKKGSILLLWVLGIVFCLVIPAEARGNKSRHLEPRGQIIVSSQKVMRDEWFSISLTGFEPGKKVRVRAEEKDDIGVIWRSMADYRIGANGQVNLDQQSPVAGSFDEADSMALLMSMKAKNPKKQPDFCKKNFNPITTKISVSVGKYVVDEVKVSRLILADYVEMEPLHKDGLAGVLFRPKKGKSYPGIIVLGGRQGGCEIQRAAVLAAHGYVTLALAYFKYEGLPGDLVDLPLEYFEKAIRWFKSQPGIAPERLGVTGEGLGGELALLLASRYPDLKAVAAVNPSGLIWQSPKIEGLQFATASCWSSQGKPLPYVPYDAPKTFMLSWAGYTLAHRPFSTLPMFVGGLKKAAPKTIEKATIPVEDIKGSIWIASAECATVWPERTFGRMIEKRLKEKGFRYPFEHIEIEGVGHVVPDPFMPVNDIRRNRELVETAGKAKTNRYGSVKQWFSMVAFFEKHLKEEAK